MIEIISIMTLIIGLDISTATVGICVFDSDTMKHVLLDHVSFDDDQNVWSRADRVRDRLVEISAQFKIEVIGVEEIAIMYTPGQSSANTITKLARFNGLVSYIARNTFGMDPLHVSVGDLRRACGLKMKVKKKASGKSHKEQAFDVMIATDLKNHPFPRKKATKKNPDPGYVNWCYDECDSYVVAKGVAALL